MRHPSVFARDFCLAIVWRQTVSRALVIAELVGDMEHSLATPVKGGVGGQPPLKVKILHISPWRLPPHITPPHTGINEAIHLNQGCFHPLPRDFSSSD